RLLFFATLRGLGSLRLGFGLGLRLRRDDLRRLILDGGLVRLLRGLHRLRRLGLSLGLGLRLGAVDHLVIVVVPVADAAADLRHAAAAFLRRLALLVRLGRGPVLNRLLRRRRLGALATAAATAPAATAATPALAVLPLARCAGG